MKIYVQENYEEMSKMTACFMASYIRLGLESILSLETCDSPKSNHYFMNKNLFSNVNIYYNKINLPNGNAKDMKRNALNGKINPEFPTSVLQLHNNVIVVLDKEATARL